MGVRGRVGMSRLDDSLHFSQSVTTERDNHFVDRWMLKFVSFFSISNPLISASKNWTCAFIELLGMCDFSVNYAVQTLT